MSCEEANINPMIMSMSTGVMVMVMVMVILAAAGGEWHDRRRRTRMTRIASGIDLDGIDGRTRSGNEDTRD